MSTELPKELAAKGISIGADTAISYIVYRRQRQARRWVVQEIQ